MEKYETIEKYFAYGRGEVHLVKLSDRQMCTNPRELVGKAIVLDGLVQIVKGVETPLIPWERPRFGNYPEAFRIVGLLLELDD